MKIPVNLLNLETLEELKDNKEERYLLKEIHKNNHNVQMKIIKIKLKQMNIKNYQ